MIDARNLRGSVNVNKSSFFCDCHGQASGRICAVRAKVESPVLKYLSYQVAESVSEVVCKMSRMVFPLTFLSSEVATKCSKSIEANSDVCNLQL